MATYLKDDEFFAGIDDAVEYINKESTFGGHDEPVITRDTMIHVMCEIFGIFPESTRGVDFIEPGASAPL